MASASLAEAAQGRRNVRVVLLSTLLSSIGMSMWQGQMLSLFLYNVVTPDAEQIGLMEGLQGLTQLLSGVSAGWLADKLGGHHRNLLIRLFTFYSLFVVLFNMHNVLHSTSIGIWYVCCCLFAPVVAVQRALVESIFADSVPSGSRVRDYTDKRSAQILGQLAGPLVQALVLTGEGSNVWRPDMLRLLMVIGAAFSGAGCLTQLWLDQADTLGLQSEAVVASLPGDLAEPLNKREEPAPPPACHSVRWIILAYDLVRVSFGGLAVKFFGMYFETDFGMAPETFLWLTVLVFLAQMAFSQVGAQLCHAGYRRTRVCFGLLVVNSCGNFLVGYGHSERMAATGWVLREGGLGGVFHIKQTIMMDFTPKANRAIWNSVDSLNSSFWAGSAMFGGMLIRRYGYRANFQVMSWGFALASTIWSVLFCKARHV